jgi:RNA polymerase sigma factor (sigma-70 family)
MQHPQSNDRTRNAGFARNPDVNSGSCGHCHVGFRFTHQRTAPALLAFARSTISDRQLAEDLVQQTFVVAIESRSDWDGERSLLPWLMGILAHRARNLRRREQQRAHAVLEDDAPAAPTGATDPHRAAANREFAGAFQDAIDELPEPYGPVVGQMRGSGAR